MTSNMNNRPSPDNPTRREQTFESAGPPPLPPPRLKSHMPNAPSARESAIASLRASTKPSPSSDAPVQMRAKPALPPKPGNKPSIYVPTKPIIVSSFAQTDPLRELPPLGAQPPSTVSSIDRMDALESSSSIRTPGDVPEGELKRLREQLRDTNYKLERLQLDQENKPLVRHWRALAEEANASRETAVNAKRQLESELRELTATLGEARAARAEAEARLAAAERDRTDWRARLDEAELELSGLVKRCSLFTEQRSEDSGRLAQLGAELQAVTLERDQLRTQLADVQTQLHNATLGKVDVAERNQAEARVRDLEARLELEQIAHKRALAKLERRDDNQKILEDERINQANQMDSMRQQLRRANRQLREFEEIAAERERQLEDLQHKRIELQSTVDALDMELSHAQNDLRSLQRRYIELQRAMAAEESFSELELGPDPDDGTDESEQSSPLKTTTSGGGVLHASSQLSTSDELATGSGVNSASGADSRLTTAKRESSA